MINNSNLGYFQFMDANIHKNKGLREPQLFAYNSAYKHFITDQKETNAIIVLPTGERVIIVIGAINALISRISGTLNKYISCIA